MGLKHKKRKKKKVGNNLEDDALVQAPHSIVAFRGSLGKEAKSLMYDLRTILEPFTASKLKAKSTSTIKDYLSVCGSLHVTHLLIFSQTSCGLYLKIIVVPTGPTLTFKLSSFALVKDVTSFFKNVSTNPLLFSSHPLLILNGFAGEELKMSLMTTLFNNLFPSINVSRVNLKSVRRCLLLNHQDDMIQIRHYAIKIVPFGVKRSIRKIIMHTSKIPDLSRYNDISSYVTKGVVSESEVEADTCENSVTLSQSVHGSGNRVGHQSAIRLVEIGPRISMKLVKITKGVCDGEVLYHSFVKKSPHDVENLGKRRKSKEELKRKRREEQERNVKKKMKLKEALLKHQNNGKKIRMKRYNDSNYDGEDGDEKQPDNKTKLRTKWPLFNKSSYKDRKKETTRAKK